MPDTTAATNETVATETAAQPAAQPAAADHFTRDDFGAKKRRYGKVTFDDGREAYFQSLSASELAKWDAGCLGEDGKVDNDLLDDQQSKLLALVLVDKVGKRLFKDEEFQILADTDSVVITPIFRAVRKHLGLDRRADAEKN